jgi:ATP-dependent Clp protease protease subunit
MTYLTAQEALEYGLIDRVLTSQKQLPAPVPAGAGVSPGNPGIS